MLPFVPRKVAKTLRSTSVANDTQTHTTNAGSPSSIVQTQSASVPDDVISSTKGKAKETRAFSVSTEDLAALFSLSLSEYALWADPDLRRHIETGDEGYIPLSYLVATSSYFLSLDSIPPEALLVKAIRSHLIDLIEIRVLMSSPSRAEWYGRHGSTKDPGGYEIRLRNYPDTLKRAGEHSRQDWDAKTIYIENIPPQFRTYAGVSRLVRSLLSKGEYTSCAESVSFPRHHLDKPSDIPKCKGFALVVLNYPTDIGHLLEEWAWRRTRSQTQETVVSAKSEAEANPERLEALNFGFRVIEKTRWEQLNQEYLAYRQRLLDDIARSEVAGAEAGNASTPAPALAASSSSALRKEEEASFAAEDPVVERDEYQPVLDVSAPFPPGCLVFIRHVHPETNKTTLRKLFSQAFLPVDATSAATVSGDPIDYVDFNKGMDTCYLRLASPHITDTLQSHFAQNPTVQMQNLDDTGSASSGGKKSIAVEIVSGEREELYWGKVPEKVRRQAVEKAIKAMYARADLDIEQATTGEVEPKEGRRRKRRRA